MVKLLAVMVLLLTSTSGLAAAIKCDGAKGKFSFEKSELYGGSVEAVLTVMRRGKSTILRFHDDWVGLECRKTKSGKRLFVFQAYCGGSKCLDLDNFGIIDPVELRVLLVPSDHNRQQAREILELNSEPAQVRKMQNAWERQSAR